VAGRAVCLCVGVEPASPRPEAPVRMRRETAAVYSCAVRVTVSGVTAPPEQRTRRGSVICSADCRHLDEPALVFQRYSESARLA